MINFVFVVHKAAQVQLKNFIMSDETLLQDKNNA